MSYTKVTFCPYMSLADKLFIRVCCALVRLLRVPAYLYATFWVYSSGGVIDVSRGLALRSRYEFDVLGVFHRWFRFVGLGGMM